MPGSRLTAILYTFNHFPFFFPSFPTPSTISLCLPQQKCLCGQEELKPSEMEVIGDKILEEADLDGDHRLSYVEFEHVISRAPDFINTFRIRI